MKLVAAIEETIRPSNHFREDPRFFEPVRLVEEVSQDLEHGREIAARWWPAEPLEFNPPKKG